MDAKCITQSMCEVISIDENKGVVFITRKPIKASNEQEEVFVSLFKKNT